MTLRLRLIITLRTELAMLFINFLFWLIYIYIHTHTWCFVPFFFVCNSDTTTTVLIIECCGGGFRRERMVQEAGMRMLRSRRQGLPLPGVTVWMMTMMTTIITSPARPCTSIFFHVFFFYRSKGEVSYGRQVHFLLLLFFRYFFFFYFFFFTTAALY